MTSTGQVSRCALVKLYVDEPGRTAMMRVLESSTAVATGSHRLCRSASGVRTQAARGRPRCSRPAARRRAAGRGLADVQRPRRQRVARATCRKSRRTPRSARLRRRPPRGRPRALPRWCRDRLRLFRRAAAVGGTTRTTARSRDDPVTPGADRRSVALHPDGRSIDGMNRLCHHDVPSVVRNVSNWSSESHSGASRPLRTWMRSPSVQRARAVARRKD